MAVNVGELVATSLRHRNKEFADNITTHNALLARLQSKGNIRLVDGGRTIMEELMYAENSTFKWYSDLEALDTTRNDVLDSAEFDIKQANCNVIVSGLDEAKNAGRERVIDLVESRIKVANITMRNNIAIALFNDGTTANQLHGLKFLVADDPTAASTVGGIAQATYSFWRNQTEVGPVATATIQDDMNALWIKTVRGSDKTDLIVYDATYFAVYEASLQLIQRFAEPSMAKLGFDNIAYKSAAVIYDDNCPSGVVTAANARGYFLNTDYLYLRPHKDKNFTTGEAVKSYNQDAYAVPVFFYGNLTTSNRSLQGVMKPS